MEVSLTPHACTELWENMQNGLISQGMSSNASSHQELGKRHEGLSLRPSKRNQLHLRLDLRE
jgi:hypothetical protein